MEFHLEIIPTNLLNDYHSLVADNFRQSFEKLHDSDLSADTFSFYTSVSVVFSSKIEGEKIELDSFIKHKKLGVRFLPDYTQKIDDLYESYQFAQKSKISEENIGKAHALLTKHILHKSKRGKIRAGNMFVLTNEGKIEYVAPPAEIANRDIEKFYRDFKYLTEIKLGIKEIFFFASLIHLIFVKIHPYDDGNGRTARLLEKWFLAEKLGEKAWFIQSEKYYYSKHQTYYNNIRRLGLDYDSLDYSQALPFLMMLPESLNL